MVDSDDQSTAYIDCVAHGDMVYSSWSKSEEHLVERLIGLKSDGVATSVASGWVKVVEAQKLEEEIIARFDPPSANGPMPKVAADLIGDRPLKWSVENDGNGTRLEFFIPRGVIQGLGKWAGGN